MQKTQALTLVVSNDVVDDAGIDVAADGDGGFMNGGGDGGVLVVVMVLWRCADLSGNIEISVLWNPFSSVFRNVLTYNKLYLAIHNVH
ncbi:Hypothetical predicted protein [Octopus vulgaris]|uniref:Uncharacterized protein n=1 Tax=Octopus vulgaris TaxID=6645 RepID=A0AA36BD40_OCTVU|nr:Hypothetical predicted protein [Octopus vulgaris]